MLGLNINHTERVIQRGDCSNDFSFEYLFRRMLDCGKKERVTKPPLRGIRFLMNHDYCSNLSFARVEFAYYTMAMRSQGSDNDAYALENLLE